jgi:uncharacterized protein (TIGR02145 family)
VSDDSSASADLRWTIAVQDTNLPPQFTTDTATLLKTVTAGQQYTVTLSAVDPNHDVLKYALVQSPNAMTIDSLTGKIVWVPTVTDTGTRTIKTSVRDAEFAKELSWNIRVDMYNRKPVLASPGNKAVNENQLLSFTLSASDSDGNTITYSVKNAPAGASLNVTAFSWTPTYAQAGTYPVTFVATDNGTPVLVDSAVISITVVDVALDSVVDIDGNVYHTVTIGTQVWMVENLKTTKYNDGTAIPLVTDPTAWSNLTTPGYCWYNNDVATYKNPYGALYNWYTVKTSKLAPVGWHVPTDAEWSVLTTFLGGLSGAGGKLKEAGTTHWNAPNSGATNETGFSALADGYRNMYGSFIQVGNYGYWWSSTASDASNSWYRTMYYNTVDVSRDPNFTYLGFGVRCVKGEPVLMAPSITTQPKSQTVTAGKNDTFSVTATGTAPLSYQWYKNGTAISGATSSSYSISNVQAADAGTYTVTVSNGTLPNATSNGAVLTVNGCTVAPYTVDASTVLLDHFDGSTSAGISAYLDTCGCGSSCGATTPTYAYSSGQSGLGQAITMSPPAGQPAGSASYLKYSTQDILCQANGTIEFWVYPTAYNTALVDQGPHFNACSGWTFSISINASGHIRAYDWANTSSFDMTSSQVVPLNAWSHVAVTWGSAGAKLYLNGVQVGSHSSTNYPASGYGGYLLMRCGTETGDSFGIDELRISNVQRTSFNECGP